MIGPIICSVARLSGPKLVEMFVREAVRAAAFAAGAAAVGGVVRVVRDRYEQQQKALPYNNDRGWRK